MTPGENCYILGYIGPNRINEDVPQMAWTLIAMVQSSDPEYETVTRGSPYHFTILSNPVTGHIGKAIISPNW